MSGLRFLPSQLSPCHHSAPPNGNLDCGERGLPLTVGPAVGPPSLLEHFPSSCWFAPEVGLLLCYFSEVSGRRLGKRRDKYNCTGNRKGGVQAKTLGQRDQNHVQKSLKLPKHTRQPCRRSSKPSVQEASESKHIGTRLVCPMLQHVPCKVDRLVQPACKNWNQHEASGKGLRPCLSPLQECATHPEN